MKIRIAFTAAALAVMLLAVQHVAAQQMTPYGMPMGSYQPMVPMAQMAPAAYPAPYMAAMPPQFDVRQAALAQQPMPAAGCTDCADGTCGATTCNQCCGSPCWCHCVAVWGEYLYLRPRNAEVAYGVPIDGPIVGPPTDFPVQVGRIGMTDPDYSSGIRFGVGYVLDGCTSVSAQYSWYEEDTSDFVETQAPDVIRSLVSHPGTLTAAQDFLSAQASQRLRFDWLDLDYRRVLDCSENRLVTVLAGTRVGQYRQAFTSDYFNTGTETVDTEIDFYGAGLRLGLEGERYCCSRRWLVYAKSAANLVAGQFTADYRQSQSFDPQVVDTTWKAGRIVPQLDLELGAGWQSRCGTWRITGGYVVSAWYNTVKTDDWIKAVQSNDFVSMSDTLTFDGLVLRCEGRF